MLTIILLGLIAVCFYAGGRAHQRAISIDYKQRWLTATSILSGTDDSMPDTGDGEVVNGWTIKRVITNGTITATGMETQIVFFKLTKPGEKAIEVRPGAGRGGMGIVVAQDDFPKYLAQLHEQAIKTAKAL